MASFSTFYDPDLSHCIAIRIDTGAMCVIPNEAIAPSQICMIQGAQGDLRSILLTLFPAGPAPEIRIAEDVRDADTIPKKVMEAGLIAAAFTAEMQKRIFGVAL